jgi:hypothetical protein
MNNHSFKAECEIMYHLLYLSVTVHFVCLSLQTTIIFLNSVNQLILVMVKCGVLFEVRNEFLNSI